MSTIVERSTPQTVKTSDMPSLCSIWMKTGVSISKITDQRIRKGVGEISKRLYGTLARVKGNLKRMTIMPVISAAETCAKLYIVMPGKRAHFHRNNDGEI